MTIADDIFCEDFLELLTAITDPADWATGERWLGQLSRPSWGLQSLLSPSGQVIVAAVGEPNWPSSLCKSWADSLTVRWCALSAGKFKNRQQCGLTGQSTAEAAWHWLTDWTYWSSCRDLRLSAFTPHWLTVTQLQYWRYYTGSMTQSITLKIKLKPSIKSL